MSKSALPTPRPGVFATEIYRPGRPLKQVLADFGLSKAFKLASNENLFGSSPKALKALEACLTDVNYYPDTNCHELGQKLAARSQVDLDQVVFGNGTVELIYDLIRTFVGPGDSVVMGAPSFSAYPIATRLCQGEAREVPLDAAHRLDLDLMAQAVDETTKLVFVPNPNNPTGTLHGRAALERFLDRLPEGPLVIFDQAYHDYIDAADYPDGVEWLREGRPVMVLRSLSKSLGIAGLRIGYGLAPTAIADALRQVQVPFHCSIPGQVAALAGLEDQDFVTQSRDRMIEARKKMFQGLKQRDLEPIPSQANFLMFRSPQEADRDFARSLMKLGWILRPGSDLGAPGWIRVTVAPQEWIADFFQALDQVRGELPGQGSASATPSTSLEKAASSAS